ncbi:MAG: UDP-N-acetylglucosamine 2-epimerase (hydrolyzing) [Deltaproteobacteria bacterium]|nr:UDP-N-acetylglucosamine 2-epimerase (hydrolyzing) [Deltaproteobacteria bacterium]
MEPKRIMFVTGTRADFGKLKPLMEKVRDTAGFEYGIFATGMHMLARYGSTVLEITKAGFDRIFPYINQDASVNSQMDLVLANTIQGLGHYVRESRPDMIVIHGDRIEALAGAIVGALNDILVAHVEGGELSGTIDELLRHSISKLSHVHFVSNEDARRRLVQMGEAQESVLVIGSPDIDIMLSSRLPALQEVKSYYSVPFDDYSIVMYHPVVTELPALRGNIREVLAALQGSGSNYVVIYPNNDSGSEIIMQELEALRGQERFRLLPSMRFEYFLTLLKNATSIVGNSSSGIHEAPVYGVPTINIGTRQLNRFQHPSIVNVPEDATMLLEALRGPICRVPPCFHFGDGESATRFAAHLRDPDLWSTPRQKQFRDLRSLRPPVSAEPLALAV